MKREGERDERREGSQMGGRLAACIWVHSKSLTGDGQRHMEIFRGRERESSVEADIWDCATVQDDHDWVSEYSLAMHGTENLGELC